MFGTRILIKRGSRDEAEKPFWISFSDMMSALMVLFLVVMSVALLAVTKRVTEEELAEKQRNKEIQELMDSVSTAAKAFEGITVNGNSIDFGKRAEFDWKSHVLPEEKAAVIRAFVPKVLEIARNPLGEKWLKRIVVEGFTDQTGTYLYNLHLSLLRSERVLCVLLSPPPPGETPMTDDERDQVRKLFLVGGYSSNSAKGGAAQEDRRIELRLEFLTDPRKPGTAPPEMQPDVSLVERCQI